MQNLSDTAIPSVATWHVSMHLTPVKAPHLLEMRQLLYHSLLL